MKIEFVTQDDPLYILPFFIEFFRDYFARFEIVMVSTTRVMGKRSRIKLFRELLWLYRPIGLVHLAARLIRYKFLSMSAWEPKNDNCHSLRQLCRAYGVPYQSDYDPNQPEFIEGVKHRGVDVLVSVACPVVLKRPILTAPSRGCINIHHAPLPRYKGMMPTFWQLYHGEKQVGVTVHFMSEKLDHGDVLLQDWLDVTAGESLDALIRRSKKYGAHCVARALDKIESNQLAPIAAQSVEGSYFTFPDRQQIGEFHRRGLRAI